MTEKPTRRWKVLESDKPSPIYNGIVCMISASDRVIAVVTEDEQPFLPDDWPAAAHLIACAPELLAFVMLYANDDPVFAKGAEKTRIAEARALVAKASAA